MTRRYCSNCQQYVDMARPWSWGVFILVTLLTVGWGLILYPLYWIVFKVKRCPICNGDRYIRNPEA